MQSKSKKPRSAQEELDHDTNILNTLNPNIQTPHLRFWELQNYAVILGKSNKATIEVNEHACNKHNIPILKRPSGGGTVLLGPGCLCYTLFIPTSHPQCATISQTNSYIMTQNATALSQLNTNTPVTIKGYTDLCLDELKFSGNAQRRTRNMILFHGTILYDFDLKLISKVLNHPSKEPIYRNQRSHDLFIQNFPHPKSKIIASLSKIWETQHANIL